MNEPYPDEVAAGQSDGQPGWVRIFAVVIGIALIFVVIGALAYAIANNSSAPVITAFVDLTSPMDGSTMDANNAVIVSGIAAVQGGTLTVEAWDQAGVLLAQQSVADLGSQRCSRRTRHLDRAAICQCPDDNCRAVTGLYGLHHRRIGECRGQRWRDFQ